MNWPKWLAPLILTGPPGIVALLLFIPLDAYFRWSGWKEVAAFYGVYVGMILVWFFGILFLAGQEQACSLSEPPTVAEIPKAPKRRS